MGRACGTYDEEKKYVQGFVGKSEGKRPLGRLERLWEDNIKMDLTKTECEDVEWTDLAPDRGKWQTLVNTMMNLRVPRNAENFLTMWETINLSKGQCCTVSVYNCQSVQHTAQMIMLWIKVWVNRTQRITGTELIPLSTATKGHRTVKRILNLGFRWRHCSSKRRNLWRKLRRVTAKHLYVCLSVRRTFHIYCQIPVQFGVRYLNIILLTIWVSWQSADGGLNSNYPQACTELHDGVQQGTAGASDGRDGHMRWQ